MVRCTEAPRSSRARRDSWLRLLMMMVVFLVLVPALPVFADPGTFEDLLVAQSAVLEARIEGKIGLEREAAGGLFDEITAELYWFPKDDKGLGVQVLDTDPPAQISTQKILWTWPGQETDRVSELSYGVVSRLQTVAQPPQVIRRIRFPLDPKTIPTEAKLFLKPTSKIDSDTSAIKDLAERLTRDEKDTWVVVTKMAEWVRTNVDYDLATLDLDAKQLASQVAISKKGVCRELSVLFIALLRASGIPARFVSGIAFTNAPEFEDGYSGHAWAEVYFPSMGWVPWDVTFGQHGLIDAGHIKLSHSADPDDPTIRVKWRARNAKAVLGDVALKATVLSLGARAPPRISLSPRLPLDGKVGIGSYVLLEMTVKNLGDAYMTTELRMANTESLEPIDAQDKLMVLGPREEKQVFWKVRVASSLDPGYTYTMPLLVKSTRGERAEINLEVDPRATVYSLAEVTSALSLALEATQKPLGEQLHIDCAVPVQAYIDEQPLVECILENTASVTLRDLRVCLKQSCETVLIAPGKEVPVVLQLPEERAGSKEYQVTARSEQVAKGISLHVELLDRPLLEVTGIDAPATVRFDEAAKLIARVKKASYAPALNVNAVLTSRKTNTKLGTITQERVDGPLVLEWDIPAGELRGGANRLLLRIEWQDTQGNRYELEKERTIELEANWYQRIVIFFRGFLKSLLRFGQA